MQGRRIYYSHVDGDGWHNASEFPGYANRRGGATAALLGEIFERYPDLPVTVAPIGADLDPAMAGSPEAVELARRVFALRHVEAGTHTYTHPFRWDFFARYDPARERAWLARKDNGAKASHRHGRQHPQDDHADDPPRAHFHVPFDVEREIGGSTGLIQAVAGKPVRLVQWSGDARPFAQALAAAAARGLGSINGGDSRFDPEFPSLLYVAPHADTTTGIVQPFASNSNENTYTGLWGRRFFGQRYLKATLANTEAPVRLKPFNLYYHNYSGERVASIAALRELLDHARSQEIAPVTASHYAAIVQGFHTTRLIAVGENAWRIEDRGSLDTIRFDHATFLAIDFDRSRGVIGQRHHQGSLYVALDPAEKTALVALAPADHADLLVQAARPYIVSGRWLASEVAATSGSARYRARGFGKGEFTWWHPDASAAAITVTDEAGTVLWSGDAHRDVTGCLSFSADADAIDGVVITIQFQPGGRCASTSC